MNYSEENLDVVFWEERDQPSPVTYNLSNVNESKGPNPVELY